MRWEPDEGSRGAWDQPNQIVAKAKAVAVDHIAVEESRQCYQPIVVTRSGVYFAIL
jgi:hypothetical protein